MSLLELHDKGGTRQQIEDALKILPFVCLFYAVLRFASKLTMYRNSTRQCNAEWEIWRKILTLRPPSYAYQMRIPCLLAPFWRFVFYFVMQHLMSQSLRIRRLKISSKKSSQIQRNGWRTERSLWDVAFHPMDLSIRARSAVAPTCAKVKLA